MSVKWIKWGTVYGGRVLHVWIDSDTGPACQPQTRQHISREVDTLPGGRQLKRCAKCQKALAKRGWPA